MIANIYCILQDELLKEQISQGERLLKEITKRLIDEEGNLDDFGLFLKCTTSEIKKARADNRKIDRAGWSLACKWWKSKNLSRDRKMEILPEAANAVGKDVLRDEIQEIINEMRTSLEYSRTPNGQIELSNGHVGISADGNGFGAEIHNGHTHVANGVEDRNKIARNNRVLRISKKEMVAKVVEGHLRSGTIWVPVLMVLLGVLVWCLNIYH